MTENSLEQMIERVTEDVLTALDLTANDLRAIEGGSVVVNAENLDAASAGRLIDHTLLKPESSPAQVEKLCAEAREFHCASVCVNPAYVELAAKLLANTDVAVCTVAGFPLGATLPEVKAFEARMAIANGATEVDMVINIGALKARDYRAVERGIATVARACHSAGAILKVIIENALLTDEERIAACVIAKAARVDFVKTSTGFAKSGAVAKDVALMRRVVGDAIGVKAAGGIRSFADFKNMVAAGANRIGASSTVKILREAREGISDSAASEQGDGY